MSVVTNLILAIASSDNEMDIINEVNSFVYRGINMNLVSADFNKNDGKRTVWYGGTKYLEAGIYIGAFNNFPLADFVEHLKNIKWECPESVQLIVKEQNEDKFKIINVCDTCT